jgi:hypothetical protein
MAQVLDTGFRLTVWPLTGEMNTGKAIEKKKQ